MRLTLSTTAATLLCLAATACPASAASIPELQAKLNAALIGLPSAQSLDANGEMTVNLTDKRITRDGSVGNVQIHASWSSRKQKTDATATATVEGRAVVDTFSSTVSAATTKTPPITLDGPIALQWKMIDQTFYARVEQLPNSIRGFLKGIGMDPTAFVGQWASASPSDVTSTAVALPKMSLSTGLPTSLPTLDELNALNSLKSTPIILVQSNDAIWADTNYHHYARVHGRINPKIISAVLRLDTALIPQNDPTRATRLKELNTQFAKLQKALANVQVAANLDLTTGYITRLEFGGTTTQPQQTCTWNTKSGKEACHNATNQTVRFSLGISFSKDTGAAIQAPAGAIPFKDLVSKQPEHATSTP
jgi:hypothetical protein